MTNAQNFRVLIVGGGNCGLAIATGLKKAEISYTIFERDTEHDFTHKTRDWGMLMHWSTPYFEKLLPPHLGARIKDFRVDPACEMKTPVPYMKADTGEIVRYVETPVINRVSRRKIRKLLVEDGVEIEFEKTLRSIEVEGEKVVLGFEDGTTETGDMVIGCDGSRSLVRHFLVGDELAKLEDTGHTMINYAASGYTPEQAHLLRSWHPIVQLCFNHPNVPGGSLLAALDIPDPNNTTHWKFQTYTSWSGPPYASDLQDPTVRAKWVRERMAQFCEPFRTAFLALPEDTVFPVYPAGQWAPRMKWGNYGGRVTIAGDAAHSMLPHRGQGLNNALKDASDLVDAIKAAVAGTRSLAEGVTTYEDEMRSRGTKEVEMSYEQAQATVRKDLSDSPIVKFGHGRPTGQQGDE